MANLINQQVSDLRDFVNNFAQANNHERFGGAEWHRWDRTIDVTFCDDCIDMAFILNLRQAVIDHVGADRVRNEGVVSNMDCAEWFISIAVD
jgi:hypothetical protein